MQSAKPNIHEEALREKLRMLSNSYRGPAALLKELESFVRTAPDEDIFRINPCRYAATHDHRESEVIDLFLHARKAGLFTMEWQYVCHVCGMVVESFHELNTAGEHFFCNMCIADREADLSEYVEIAFTVPKSIRPSRFHDPQSLEAMEFMLTYATSDNALARDGTRLRDFYERHTVAVSFIAPGETRTFEIDLVPGFIALTHGPELIVTPDAERQLETLDFTHRDNRPPEEMLVVKPGKLTFNLTNDSPARIATSILRFTASEIQSFKGKKPGVVLEDFLSGARLLSTQTFLDLFPSETVMSAGGLAVRRITFLFSDLKGSTALYDRIGDMKAFNLVREHFAILREVIAANNGALVKTIGDAVMASFHGPRDAIKAAGEMLTRIEPINRTAGEDLILLKIGIHTGHCLAVTLNDHLDYFGQTVNLAARVQGLAAENEICLTENVFQLAGASDLLGGMDHQSRPVHVKGIESEITVHTFGKG